MDQNWKVECETSGRDGYIGYFEDDQVIPFYWEYGGGDVVVIVRVEDPDKFDRRFPWAANRRREILERTAAELIRQNAPTCRADIDVTALSILLRESPPVQSITP